MKRNFLYTAVSVGSRMLVGVVLFVVLARLWGPADFGLYSYAFSVASLLMLVVDFGFVTYLMREVAANRDRSSDLVVQAFAGKVMLLVSAILLLWPLLIWVSARGGQGAPFSILVPLMLATAFLSFGDFFVAPLRALGRYDLEARVVTVGNAVQFAVSGSAAWAGASPATVAWTTALARLAYMGMALQSLRGQMPELRLAAASPRAGCASLRRVLPYGADAGLVTCWNQLDVVIVRWLHGLDAVGLYSAGQKIVLGVGALATVVGNVMVPRLASESTRHDGRFWLTARLTFLLMLGIGVLFSAPLVLAPELVTRTLFGPAFAPLQALLPLFALVLLIRYLGAAAGAVITGAGRQGSRALAQLAGLAVAGSMVWLAHAQAWSLQALILVLAFGLVVTMLFTLHGIWRFRQLERAETAA